MDLLGKPILQRIFWLFRREHVHLKVSSICAYLRLSKGPSQLAGSPPESSIGAFRVEHPPSGTGDGLRRDTVDILVTHCTSSSRPG